MNIRKLRRALEGGNLRVSAWAPLLLLLLLSMLVTGVVAQDGTDGEPPDLTFLEDEGKVLPENAKAAAGEVWIPASKDSFVSSNDPNRNFGLQELVRFGFSPSSFGATRPLFKYKVEAYIPSDAKITKAELHVYLTNFRDSDTSRGYAAHNLTQAWDEQFVTWNNMPSYGPEIGRGTLGNSPGWQVTDITNQVKEWLKNPGNNKGVILIGDERPDQNYERDYFSRETSSGNWPRLFVSFDTSTDDVAPVADVVLPSPGSWSPADFIVGWDGHDPPNSDGSPGSGIRWFDVYYSTNQGASWKIGRAQVTNKQTNVNGAPNMQRYDFYARAMDNAGNEGPVPSGPSSSQSWTRIDAEAPQATMNPLPEFMAHHSFPVSWQDTKEQNESGIRYYDVQYREGNGQWQQLVYHTTATSTTFNKGQNGLTYEFRARGVDNVGNEQPWGEAQASTTVWLQPLAYIVPFDAPAIYQKLNGPEVGDGFTVAWEGLAPPGTTITSFDVRYQRPNSSTWLVWLDKTTQSSAKFELALGDPDGAYRFQVRATDDQGVTGEYLEEGGDQMFVDRHAPFFGEQSILPFVIDN